MLVGEVGSIGWSLGMGPAGMVVIAPKPPIPGTIGYAGLKSSMVCYRYFKGDRDVGRSDMVI